MDRMFLISSAITKAFHGDHATHTRFQKIGGVEDDTGGSIVHLSQQEQRTIINALVEQRERQEEAMTQTEQLLRRMTGSITAYINEVGMKPLRMCDYDKAVLAIRDGEMAAFTECAAKVPEHADALLVEAAGRPGLVGRNMTAMLLNGRTDVDYSSYCAACKKAIDINDVEKSLFLLHWAEHAVPQLEPSFYGEMACYAHLEHRFIAEQIIHQCFELLDGYITAINEMAEGGASLDKTRVKAIFYALYFGADDPGSSARQEFADCFTKYETRTRTVTRTDEDGNEVEVEESYTVALLITDLAEVYQNLDALLGSGITAEQKDNADSVYNLIRYGATGGAGGGGLVTLYGHCSKLLATVGQTVLAGDVIALSGSTGRSTGPHLHFEVRVNGERTNPRSYLP